MAFNFPSSPSVGAMHEGYVWDGQKWIVVGAGSVIIASSPPTIALSGDLWWDSDSGVLYIYYFDGTSSQWVETSGSGAVDEAPADGLLYGRKNALWELVPPPGGVAPSDSLPAMDGAAAVGVSAAYSRGDHVHPSDTARVAKTGDTMSGTLGLLAPPGDQPIVVETRSNTYSSTFTALSLRQFNNVASGSFAGLPLAGLGQLWFQNVTYGLIAISNDAPLQININSTKVAEFKTNLVELAVSTTAPTPAVSDKSTKVATTAFVNTYAAPLDALAFNGMQINGAMEVDQPNTAVAVAFATGPVAKHTIDNFYVRKSGTNTFTVQQVTSVFLGYNKALKLTVTTAQASLGSDNIFIDGLIEGYRFVRAQWGTANAVPVTLGFWVKSSVAGTLVIQLINAAFDLAVSGGVVITTPNVAQWVTCTFTAQTTGNWLSTNGVGARLVIAVAVTGSINIAATNANTFEMTGLVVLPGLELPAANKAPFIMRPFDQEVVLCKRYWQKSYNYGQAVGANLGAGQGNIELAAAQYSPIALRHSPSMRTTPTIVIYDNIGAPAMVSIYNAGWVNGVAGSASNISEGGVSVQNIGLTGTQLCFDYTADARMS